MKTLEQYKDAHSQMLMTATDLGLQVPEALAGEFETPERGHAVCRELDRLVKAAAKKTNAADAPDAHTEATGASAPAKRAAKPKRAAPVRKTAAKKETKTVAKKAAAKKTPAKKKGNGTRTSYPEDHKIRWLGKENPAREGSGAHERIEAIRKANGKTVKTAVAGGILQRSLGWCARNKLISVTA